MLKFEAGTWFFRVFVLDFHVFGLFQAMFDLVDPLIENAFKVVDHVSVGVPLALDAP